ncbi:acyltransferase family protein [Cellulomonas endophytica]|uniref:acyltransferase family protein n=1 Tax=Cellulomonas endophytica TaxID=2494735 RepID=UPI001011147C|nr:acyltransferase [Cellulomonas endophytica]
MDTLRGGAILLMLLWHATSLPRLEGIPVPEGLAAANDFFAPFRMPTLMFLSGLLLPRSLGKPLGTYYRGKVALIVWPYLLWAVFYFVLSGDLWKVAAPKAYIAATYLWYLFYIASYYLLAPALRRLSPLLVAGVALAASFVVDQPLLHRMTYFAVFFFTGAWVAQRLPDPTVLLRGRVRLLLLGVPALALGVAAALLTLRYESITVPLSFAGIAVAIAAAAAVPSLRSARIRFVGRNSIVFYAVHYPVMWVLVQAGDRLGAPWWVLLPVLLAAGVAAGWAVARVRDRVPVRWLFELPLPRRARRADRPAAVPAS